MPIQDRTSFLSLSKDHTMIRNAAIAALLVVIGSTVYSGVSETIANVQAASAQFMSRTTVIGDALNYPQ
jgi:hypothetical protein